MAKGDQKKDRAAMQTAQTQSSQEYNDLIYGKGGTPVVGARTNPSTSITGGRTPQDTVGTATGPSAATGGLAGLAATSGDRASESYAGASSGYKGFADTGGLTPDDYSRLRGLYSQGSAYGNVPNLDFSAVNKSIGGLQDIGASGGITDEDKSNIMRASQLEQEKTGGYSAQDIQNVKAKAAMSSPQYFQSIKDSLARNRAVTGNLAGGQALDFKLARAKAQGAGADSLNADVGLAESIRKGRETAGTNLASQATDLAKLRTGNQLTGLYNAGNLGNTEQDITGRFNLGKAAGLDTFTGDQAKMEGDLLDARLKGQQYGVTGMKGLYDQASTNQNSFLQKQLDTTNSKYANMNDLFRLIMANKTIDDPSRFRSVLSGIKGVTGAIGDVASVAGPVMGGI